MKKGLLLSNSILEGSGYLEWCKDIITLFFKNKKNIVFIPYAAVSFDFDQYEQRVKKALSINSTRLKSIHRFENINKAVKNCDGILTGGGNTFALKKRLEDHGIFDLIKHRITNDSLAYAGWSAGANLGSISIKTTNDMPITEPQSFEAFKIVDFQINPHYTNKTIHGHNGETRDERLMEFSILNPKTPCIAIPEGSGLIRENKETTYFGDKNAKIFLKGNLYKEIKDKDIINLNEFNTI